jgi:hypothetical protein
MDARNEWIDAVKNPPPYDEFVLIAAGNLPHIASRYKVENSPDAYVVRIDRSEGTFLIEVRNVTHWMMIPHAPKCLKKKEKKS